MEHVQSTRLCTSVPCTVKVELLCLKLFGYFLYMVKWYIAVYHWDF